MCSCNYALRKHDHTCNMSDNMSDNGSDNMSDVNGLNHYIFNVYQEEAV